MTQLRLYQSETGLQGEMYGQYVRFSCGQWTDTKGGNLPKMSVAVVSEGRPHDQAAATMSALQEGRSPPPVYCRTTEEMSTLFGLSQKEFVMQWTTLLGAFLGLALVLAPLTWHQTRLRHAVVLAEEGSGGIDADGAAEQGNNGDDDSEESGDGCEF
jgi:hypothetical protein